MMNINSIKITHILLFIVVISVVTATFYRSVFYKIVDFLGEIGENLVI